MADHDRPATALVIGARRGSLGDQLVSYLHGMGMPAYRAGIVDEPLRLDIDDRNNVWDILHTVEPTHVVCTVGMNKPTPFYTDDFYDGRVALDHMYTNYLLPMWLLNAYAGYLADMPGTFVAISSNSAHIARSNSAAYCASKAALSMGIRCAARDATRAGKPLRIWGYEPGALLGTPMTNEVRAGLGKDVPMSRMLTNPAGLPVGQVARQIARDLLDAADVLHGTMVRLDNGEQ